MDFVIYVERRSWRRFSVIVYEVDLTDSERYIVQDFISCFWHRSALRYGKQLADAYFCDQTKRQQSVAIITLSLPDEKIRIVGDPGQVS